MDRENFRTLTRKDLCIPSYEQSPMSLPENAPKFTIHEYGSDVISALKDIKMKCKDIIYLGVHVLEEAEPSGIQHLKSEDIFEEIDKLPKYICKYITSVALVPFSCPYEEDGNPILADAECFKRQVTIYAIPQDRIVLKDALARHYTLAHEAGHIIDREILQNKGHSSNYLSYTPQWARAICEDSKIKRITLDQPLFLISPYAEKRQSIGEDFADSVMLFSNREGNLFLRENYPNRYRILEEFLEQKYI
jgi:hypothetical protein